MLQLKNGVPMSDNIKKQFGRAAVYDEPREIPFTTKITSKIHDAIKAVTAKRVEQSGITDVRLQPKAAQLGYEILKDWFDNYTFKLQNPNIPDSLPELKAEILRLQNENNILILQSKNSIDESEYQQLTNENERLNSELGTVTDELNTLKYLSSSGSSMSIIKNKDAEITKLKEEAQKYKNYIQEIGAAIQLTSGYYFNRAFSELKDKIILILTKL